MKKLAALLLVLCMLLTLSTCSIRKDGNFDTVTPEETVAVEEAAPVESAPADTAYEPVYVLYTNDVHCGVENGLGYNGLATAKQLMDDKDMNVLLVDNGDAIQGELIGTLTQGESIIELMNGLGYDAATPGNHEFDYGMEQFMYLTGLADFPYLSANFVNKNGEPIFDAYKIFERGGHKIAFVGVSTPETITTSTPKYFMNDNGEYIYGFCSDATGEAFYNRVQGAVDSARAEGADIVIVMSHLGIALGSSPYTSGDLIENTSGIDAVLDGHSHTVMEHELVTDKDGKKVLLTSTGTKLENIGCLEIASDGKLSSTLIDNSFPETLSESLQEVAFITEEVIAQAEVDLCIYDPETGERMVRSNETNLGDLCADAFRIIMGTDIALTNGGNVREQLSEGDITYGDIISVSPFNNEICVAEVTGQQILDSLELSVSDLPGERGGFAQVSGITFCVDVTIPSPVVLDENGMFVSVDGERRVYNVMVGDEELDSEQTYTVASTSYILKDGGDGNSMFAGCNVLVDGGKLDNQVLIEYITDVLGGVIGEGYEDPYGDGRITIYY